MKEALYVQLHLVVDSRSNRYELNLLGDFKATTSTDMDDYETCVGLHGSGSRNESALMLLDVG